MKSILYLSLALTFILSCKSENTVDHSLGLIQVSVSDALYESEETLGNRAATAQQHEAFLESNIRRNTIEVGNDFLMVAELRPEEPLSGLKDGAKAALDTTALSNNIRYRLLVYNQAGAFVTERDYIRGQEASTEALQLDGGITYTFVVFSMNLTSNLPATLPTNASTRTLANTQITTSTGANAVMYYKTTMTVSGNAINRLDIVLRHRKPQITVRINSIQTGYNISAITAVFTPHNNGTLINLSDGSYIQNGTSQPVTANFNSSIPSQNVVSSGSYINSPNNDITTFNITSITIGPLTLSNLVPFNNLNLTAGVRYNLILNIVPRDEYTTHNNVPVARINGRLWALHNLGVNTTLNHNPTTITSALHGNYYQFGRNAITAAPTATTTNSNFNNILAASNAWNGGTETIAIKNTANDPCPEHFRVPTRTDMQQLLDGVVVTRRGSFTTSNTNFGSAAILTSKRNSNVVLVLPTQGFINVNGANPPVSLPLEDRGNTSNYWTSSATAEKNPYRLLISNTTEVVGIPTGTTNFAQSRPIRCTVQMQTTLPPQS
ncbi:hypothetical protein [Sphingobacterium chungjuense]|uniref:hypothetical protein n=1 Tax=Sphingobacterium chungjuense TaxID=2675553 RepID=UPI00140892BF|nr:hypothetical protein [Sphingobacterium chungjuense]